MFLRNFKFKNLIASNPTRSLQVVKINKIAEHLPRTTIKLSSQSQELLSLVISSISRAPGMLDCPGPLKKV